MSRDASLAARIARVRLDATSGVREISGRGSVNHVFVVGATPADVVVRFARDPRRPDHTAPEAWSIAAAARAGVPGPTVLARGVLDGVPYLVEDLVPGDPVTGPGTPAVWEDLGRAAAVIATVPITPDAPSGLFSRFGRDLPAAWTAHVDYNLDALGDDDALLRLGVYHPERTAALRSRITPLRRHRWRFGLVHGDLSPRNLLCTPDGRRVLLDWDTATTGPTPWLDLAAVYETHLLAGRPDDERLAAFCAGVGIAGPRPDLAEDRVAGLVTLGVLDRVRWALQRRPDRTAELVRNARRILDVLPY